MFSFHEILDIAIRLERNGERIYRDAAGKIPDTQLASALEWMADEEVSHAGWFADLKKNEESMDESGLQRELSGQLLSSLMGEKSFSLDDVDFSKITQLSDLIELFIEFEKDTILFYEILEPFIQSRQTRTKLKQIITEEREHVDQLRTLLVSGPGILKKTD
jgi:rubrerythrin